MASPKFSDRTDHSVTDGGGPHWRNALAATVNRFTGGAGIRQVVLDLLSTVGVGEVAVATQAMDEVAAALLLWRCARAQDLKK
jgi:hypothetical protein